MAWGRDRGGGGGGCLSMLALVVALAALFVAWSAYKRTGGTVNQLTRGVVKVGDAGTIDLDNADWRGALDKAREKLQEHRSEVESQHNLEQVNRDIAQIRENLERAVHGSGGEAKEKWRSVDGDLDHLQQQLREGGAKAKAALDEVLAKMKS
ncbi:MAG TPA: hypothetical protein VH988_22865 [Thermoanaerobaculia bacterium]|nr:hypothetical protein [Thermoanaerobaculia bacterium]